MRIVELEIKNFRGIREFKWNPGRKVNCLIGPGDSGKTTILEAIERALSPGEPTFTDGDFTDLDSSKPIEILVTVGALPDDLLPDTRLGLHLRGWTDAGGLQDEPDPNDPAGMVATIRLRVEENLEPTWEVVTNRGTRQTGQRERALLGMARVGQNPGWHLSWSRRSALNRVAQGDEALGSLTEAVRTARAEFAKAPLTALKKASAAVQERAAALGSAPRAALQPLLNPSALSIAQGSVTLHDGDIPLTAAGMGTQRLTAIAVQKWAVAAGTILLLDEVESGLEPHRLRHLLRTLRADAELGQVIVTSHSAVAIAELEAPEIVAIRSSTGRVEARAADDSLQAVVRAAAEALLSPKVIVCEGKTEVGLCRAWDLEPWQRQGALPLAVRGCSLVDGGGASAGARALGLKRLGYQVALFVDGDRPLGRREEVSAAGIEIIEWTGRCTERVVFDELPWAHVQRALDLACSYRSRESVQDAVVARLASPRSGELRIESVGAWPGSPEEDLALRAALASAATADDKEWFKLIDRGENLGSVIGLALPEIPGSELARVARALTAWVDAY